jgi:hypothetical protein
VALAQQLVQAVHAVAVDALEHVLQVGPRLHAVQPRRLDQAEGHRRGLPAALGAGEQPILA